MSRLESLPEAARRYLQHTIGAESQPAEAVRLRMHGEIKLRRWLPFTAQQQIHRDHQMVWRATVRMFGLPVSGFDRLENGEGFMQWKLLGMIPLVKESGVDITRSAAGRVQAESIWLPSMLRTEAVAWTAVDTERVEVCFKAQEQGKLTLTIDVEGRLKSLTMRRWGNPDGTRYRWIEFGGLAEEEATFGNYTIPTRLRIGWFWGSKRFESEGEFFRVTVDDAKYR